MNNHQYSKKPTAHRLATNQTVFITANKRRNTALWTCKENVLMNNHQHSKTRVARRLATIQTVCTNTNALKKPNHSRLWQNNQNIGMKAINTADTTPKAKPCIVISCYCFEIYSQTTSKLKCVGSPCRIIYTVFGKPLVSLLKLFDYMKSIAYRCIVAKLMK